MKTANAQKIADALLAISKIVEVTAEDMVDELIGTAWSEDEADKIIEALDA
jgi:hypothetical protein